MKQRARLHLFLAPVLVLALLALLAVACGDDDDDANGDTEPTATEEPADDEPTATSEPEPTEEPTEAPEPTEPADGGGGGAAQVMISASGLAFSTGRIELTAGQETEIVFTNNDGSIPHNVHIVAGDVEGSMSPFSGDDGPTQSFTITVDEPGSYTFQCDVHPNMSGVVEVT